MIDWTAPLQAQQGNNAPKGKGRSQGRPSGSVAKRIDPLDKSIVDNEEDQPLFCDGAGDEGVVALSWTRKNVLVEHLLHILLLCLGWVGSAVVALSYEFSL